jgi:hypothetical protein
VIESGYTARRILISASDLVSRMAATLDDWGSTVAPMSRRFCVINERTLSSTMTFGFDGNCSNNVLYGDISIVSVSQKLRTFCPCHKFDGIVGRNSQ